MVVDFRAWLSVNSNGRGRLIWTFTRHRFELHTPRQQPPNDIQLRRTRFDNTASNQFRFTVYSLRDVSLIVATSSVIKLIRHFYGIVPEVFPQMNFTGRPSFRKSPMFNGKSQTKAWLQLILVLIAIVGTWVLSQSSEWGGDLFSKAPENSQQENPPEPFRIAHNHNSPCTELSCNPVGFNGGCRRSASGGTQGSRQTTCLSPQPG